MLSKVKTLIGGIDHYCILVKTGLPEIIQELSNAIVH